MIARLQHADQHTNVGMTLPALSAITTHTGLDHVKQIEIRWGCTVLDMDTSMAQELHDQLEKFL